MLRALRDVTPGRLRSPLALAVGPVVVLALAFYAWTAATSGDVFPGDHARDPYNLLTDAFVAGHTDLPLKPDPRLLALDDPYDPAQNQPFVTREQHDLSLHDGRFYAYWGAAPAVLLFLPWRALGVGDMSTTLAVLLFSSIGLLCSIALMVLLLRRWLPATPAWMQGAGAAMLAMGNLAPVLLRRPEAYEVAISAGACFFWAGLLALAAAGLGARVRTGLLAASSLLFGLAFASRPPLGVGILVAVAAVWLLRGRDGVSRRRLAIAVLAPFAVCALIVFAYNVQRFGSPTDFGVSYVLGGQKADRFYSLTYIAPGLWYYVLSPLLVRVEFPFLWVNPASSVPFPIPARYNGGEATSGLLPTLPLLVLLAGAPWALRTAPAGLRRVVWALAGTGGVLLLFTAFFYWGPVQRYQMDFAALFVLAALLVWFVLGNRWRVERPRAARLAAVGGVLLIAWGCLTMAAISMVGPEDRLRVRHPATFASLARAFTPVSTALAKVAGRPIIGAVAGKPLLGPARYDRLGADRTDLLLSTRTVPVELMAPHDAVATLRATVTRTPKTPDTPLLVQARSPDGSTFTAPVDGREVALPIVLRQGRNEVHLQLFPVRLKTLALFAYGGDDRGVRVTGLRVGPPPPPKR